MDLLVAEEQERKKRESARVECLKKISMGDTSPANISTIVDGLLEGNLTEEDLCTWKAYDETFFIELKEEKIEWNCMTSEEGVFRQTPKRITPKFIQRFYELINDKKDYNQVRSYEILIQMGFRIPKLEDLHCESLIPRIWSEKREIERRFENFLYLYYPQLYEISQKC